ncbi:MAG: hypothetical protein ACRC4M_01060 [Mycoplasma sp.]
MEKRKIFTIIFGCLMTIVFIGCLLLMLNWMGKIELNFWPYKGLIEKFNDWANTGVGWKSFLPDWISYGSVIFSGVLTISIWLRLSTLFQRFVRMCWKLSSLFFFLTMILNFIFIFI